MTISTGISLNWPGETSLLNEAFNEAAEEAAKRAGSGPALVQRLRPTATPRRTESGGVHISKKAMELGRKRERERERKTKRKQHAI